MHMYNEIYKLIDNDLKNYNRRTITQQIVTRGQLECIHAYTRVWAEDEARNNLARAMAKKLDEKLYNHICNVTNWGVEIGIPEPFIELLRELEDLDVVLQYEEAENLGISRSARDFRKQWRKKLRKAHKLLNLYHKNKVNWIKEHNKPCPMYELKATGECHNGLYWTLKEMLRHPSYIKYGFRRIK